MRRLYEKSWDDFSTPETDRRRNRRPSLHEGRGYSEDWDEDYEEMAECRGCGDRLFRSDLRHGLCPECFNRFEQMDDDRRLSQYYDDDDELFNESFFPRGKRVREAKVTSAELQDMYGFVRVKSEDYEDDGTLFYMYAWDPNKTGKSPFHFSKAGGHDSVYFGEDVQSTALRDELKKHTLSEVLPEADRYEGRRSLLSFIDCLNGVGIRQFNDRNVGKLVKVLKAITETPWFLEICPPAPPKADTKDTKRNFDLDKDHQRIVDIYTKSKGDPTKMAAKAAAMAKSIRDKEKMESRWQAAVDIFGPDSEVALAFERAAEEKGMKYLSINRSKSELFNDVLNSAPAF